MIKISCRNLPKNFISSCLVETMRENRCGRVFFAFLSCASSAPFSIKLQQYRAATLAKRWCVTDQRCGACLLKFLSVWSLFIEVFVFYELQALHFTKLNSIINFFLKIFQTLTIKCLAQHLLICFHLHSSIISLSLLDKSQVSRQGERPPSTFAFCTNIY